MSNKWERDRFEIMATVRSSDFDLLSNTINVLLENDITSFRFNVARDSYHNVQKAIKQCKLISEKYSIKPYILLDLPIPKRKIRISKLPKSEILVRANEYIVFYNLSINPYDKNVVILDFNKAFNLKCGQEVIYADGLGKLIVTQCEPNFFIAKASNDFNIRENKSCYWGELINSISEQKLLIELLDLIENIHPNSIALSFVETSLEIEEIRNKISKDIKIMGKIETPFAVENIDIISSLCDSLMIARGDLGVTDYMAKIGYYQREIGVFINKNSIPAFVATDVFTSFHNRYQPSRADIVDVSHIIWDGYSGLILPAFISESNSIEMIKKIVDFILSING